MGIDPATLTLISTAATAASGVISFIGGQQQAAATKAQAEYNAAIARNNQIYADRAAREAVERGQQAEAKKRMEAASLRGRQRAVLAANGVDVNSGSALDIQEDTAGLGELDALTLRSNAEREAIGYRQQGANFGGEAALYQARANAASSGALWTGVSSLLGTAGSVASKWYSFKYPYGNLAGASP